MNKSDLVVALAGKLKITKKEAHAAVEAIFGNNGGIIVSALRKGDEVSLSGFGRFEVKKRMGRKGRNPKTGEPVQIPPSAIPSFKPGKALKEKIKK